MPEKLYQRDSLVWRGEFNPTGYVKGWLSSTLLEKNG